MTEITTPNFTLTEPVSPVSKTIEDVNRAGSPIGNGMHVMAHTHRLIANICLLTCARIAVSGALMHGQDTAVIKHEIEALGDNPLAMISRLQRIVSTYDDMSVDRHSGSPGTPVNLSRTKAVALWKSDAGEEMKAIDSALQAVFDGKLTFGDIMDDDPDLIDMLDIARHHLELVQETDAIGVANMTHMTNMGNMTNMSTNEIQRMWTRGMPKTPRQ